MYKKIVIELSQKEILEIGGASRLNMDHARDSTSFTGTGIRPIFEGFYDEKYSKIKKEVVALRIFKHLEDKGLIEGKEWRIQWIPGHHWGPEDDDDGSRPSVYTLTAEVYQLERI